MQVAAARAQFGAGGDQAVVSLQIDRKDHPVDRVTRTLVVDDAARAEFGNGQEARSAEILVALVFAQPAAGNVGRERQPGEVVSRQKALAGEVAVAIEIGLYQVVAGGEQLHLGLSLGAQALGLLLVSLAARGVADDLVLYFTLLER